MWPVPATKAPFFTLASMHQIQMLLPVERERKFKNSNEWVFLSGPAQKINQEKGGTQDNSIAQKKPNIFLKSWSIMSSCCTISQAEQLVSPFQCFLVFYFQVGGGIHSLKGRFFVGASVRVLWEIEINCMHWDFGPEVSLCTSGSNGFNFTLLTYQDQLSSCSNFQTKLIFDCELTGWNQG